MWRPRHSLTRNAFASSSSSSFTLNACKRPLLSVNSLFAAGKDASSRSRESPPTCGKQEENSAPLFTAANHTIKISISVTTATTPTTTPMMRMKPFSLSSSFCCGVAWAPRTLLECNTQHHQRRYFSAGGTDDDDDGGAGKGADSREASGKASTDLSLRQISDTFFSRPVPERLAALFVAERLAAAAAHPRARSRDSAPLRGGQANISPSSFSSLSKSTNCSTTASAAGGTSGTGKQQQQQQQPFPLSPPRPLLFPLSVFIREMPAMVRAHLLATRRTPQQWIEEEVQLLRLARSFDEEGAGRDNGVMPEDDGGGGGISAAAAATGVNQARVSASLAPPDAVELVLPVPLRRASPTDDDSTSRGNDERHHGNSIRFVPVEPSVLLHIRSDDFSEEAAAGGEGEEDEADEGGYQTGGTADAPNNSKIGHHRNAALEQRESATPGTAGDATSSSPLESLFVDSSEAFGKALERSAELRAAIITLAAESLTRHATEMELEAQEEQSHLQRQKKGRTPNTNNSGNKKTDTVASYGTESEAETTHSPPSPSPSASVSPRYRYQFAEVLYRDVMRAAATQFPLHHPLKRFVAPYMTSEHFLWLLYQFRCPRAGASSDFSSSFSSSLLSSSSSFLTTQGRGREDSTSNNELKTVPHFWLLDKHAELVADASFGVAAAGTTGSSSSSSSSGSGGGREGGAGDDTAEAARQRERLLSRTIAFVALFDPSSDGAGGTASQQKQTAEEGEEGEEGEEQKNDETRQQQQQQQRQRSPSPSSSSFPASVRRRRFRPPPFRSPQRVVRAATAANNYGGWGSAAAVPTLEDVREVLKYVPVHFGRVHDLAIPAEVRRRHIRVGNHASAGQSGGGTADTASMSGFAAYLHWFRRQPYHFELRNSAGTIEIRRSPVLHPEAHSALTLGGGVGCTAAADPSAGAASSSSALCDDGSSEEQEQQQQQQQRTAAAAAEMARQYVERRIAMGVMNSLARLEDPRMQKILIKHPNQSYAGDGSASSVAGGVGLPPERGSADAAVSSSVSAAAEGSAAAAAAAAANIKECFSLVERQIYRLMLRVVPGYFAPFDLIIQRATKTTQRNPTVYENIARLLPAEFELLYVEEHLRRVDRDYARHADLFHFHFPPLVRRRIGAESTHWGDSFISDLLSSFHGLGDGRDERGAGGGGGSNNNTSKDPRGEAARRDNSSSNSNCNSSRSSTGAARQPPRTAESSSDSRRVAAARTAYEELQGVFVLLNRLCATWDRPEYVYARLSPAERVAVGGYEGMLQRVIRRHPRVFCFDAATQMVMRADLSDPLQAAFFASDHHERQRRRQQFLDAKSGLPDGRNAEEAAGGEDAAALANTERESHSPRPESSAEPHTAEDEASQPMPPAPLPVTGLSRTHLRADNPYQSPGEVAKVFHYILLSHQQQQRQGQAQGRGAAASYYGGSSSAAAAASSSLMADAVDPAFLVARCSPALLVCLPSRVVNIPLLFPQMFRVSEVSPGVHTIAAIPPPSYSRGAFGSSFSSPLGAPSGDKDSGGDTDNNSNNNNNNSKNNNSNDGNNASGGEEIDDSWMMDDTEVPTALDGAHTQGGGGGVGGGGYSDAYPPSSPSSPNNNNNSNNNAGYSPHPSRKTKDDLLRELLLLLPENSSGGGPGRAVALAQLLAWAPARLQAEAERYGGLARVCQEPSNPYMETFVSEEVDDGAGVEAGGGGGGGGQIMIRRRRHPHQHH